MNALIARHIARFKQKGNPTLTPPGTAGNPQLDPGTVGVVVQKRNQHGQLVDTLIGKVGTTDRGQATSQTEGIPRWLESWGISAWADFQSPGASIRLVHEITLKQMKLTPLVSGPLMQGDVEYNYQPLSAYSATSAQFNAVKATQHQLFELQTPEGLHGHLHRTWLEEPNLVYDVWVLRPGYMPPSPSRDVVLKPVSSPYASAGAFAIDMNRQRNNEAGWLLVTVLYYFVQA